MNWIFIGMLFGSTVISAPYDREGCEEMALAMRERGVIGQCRNVAAASATAAGLQRAVRVVYRQRVAYYYVWRRPWYYYVPSLSYQWLGWQ